MTPKGRILFCWFAIIVVPLIIQAQTPDEIEKNRGLLRGIHSCKQVGEQHGPEWAEQFMYSVRVKPELNDYLIKAP